MLSVVLDRKRIFGLDFLRALAIFFVIHGHGAFLLQDSHFAFVNKIPLPDFVDVFFVLTGFLIGGAFFRHLQNNGKVEPKYLFRFYGRTFLRILPNYYVILLVNYILVRIQVLPGNIAAFPMWQFATFTQNLLTPFYDFFWESWCLPVQWWFYIFFPLILMVCTKKVDVGKLIPVLSLVFIVISIAYRIKVSGNATDRFWWDVWIRKTVASRCDSVYVGVFAAWLQFRFSDFWQRNAKKSLIIGVMVLIVSLLLPQQPGSIYKNVLVCTVQPVAFAMLLPYASLVKSYKTKAGTAVSCISVLSYSLYLINLMVAQFISNNYSDAFGKMGGWGYVIYWMAVLVISYLLYIIVEKNFSKIRSRIR